MLEFLITSRVTRKLLAVFVTHPDDQFYTRQLERLIEEPVSAVRRSLEKLERGGLLFSKDGRGVKYFRANKEHALFAELRSMVQKSRQQDMACAGRHS